MDKRERERAKLVAAMEYIVRNVNNEELILGRWFSVGVADGDIPYGSFDPEDVPSCYTSIENTKELAELFLSIMAQAKNDGGLCVL